MTSDGIARREVLKGGTLAALVFTVAGSDVLMSPGEAYAQGVPLRTLKPEEAQTIEALGDTLVPDARKAGIANFIDQQISGPPEDALLEARIMNVRPPYANFYRAAVGAIERSVSARYAGRKLADLNAEEARAFVDDMRQGKVEVWQGPPQPFVYFLLRSDAVDVVYGTMAGYERLGIPYMPHIVPQKRW